MFGAMNAPTKITLSDKELELVCNSSWILTKHAIIKKVYALFGNAATYMQQIVLENKVSLPAEINMYNPKISKGENYLHLPYVMLDYPRYFTNEKILTIRTMFWWGNYFSVHLLLSGDFKTAAIESLLRNFSWLQNDDYFVSISDDPWSHHFEEGNYLHLAKCTKEDFSSILYSKPFIKIGKILPVKHWDNAPVFIETSFAGLAELLKH